MTYTPIQDAGKVIVRIPDLPPLKGELRWSDGTAAGMAFCLRLSSEQLSEWARTRLSWNASPVPKGPRDFSD